MDLEDFLATLSQVGRLHGQRNYEAAYQLVGELLAIHPFSADLLVKRAKLAQLLDRDAPGSDLALGAVRSDLERARTLEPDGLATVLELGHFGHAVEDDAQAGLGDFERARTLAESALREALLGKIRCLLELRELDLARSELDTAEAYFGDVDFHELRAELEQATEAP